MTGFVPPPYPYDGLAELADIADLAHGSSSGRDGGVIDLSIGTPCDPPPPMVLEALAGSDSERGYPASLGSLRYREAAAGWVNRRFGVTVDPATQVGACVGTKEFVAGLPRVLSLRTPERDTVLYPSVSYPSYAMGAALAQCRAVPVPVDEGWRLRLDEIHPSDARRALCLWVNSPGNPAGALDDLAVAAEWGRSKGVVVCSDECYAEFTWTGRPQTILSGDVGDHAGLLAVHSLSKRSNLAGVRAGFYAGDSELVRYLSEVRKHAGLIVPGPSQAAGVAAWADDTHVESQRVRYRYRLETLAAALGRAGISVDLPEGGFYLWVAAPAGDAWTFARRLAEVAGVIGSPGEFYGDSSSGHVRLAVVQPDDRIELAASRMTKGWTS